MWGVCVCVCVRCLMVSTPCLKEMESGWVSVLMMGGDATESVGMGRIDSDGDGGT